MDERAKKKVWQAPSETVGQARRETVGQASVPANPAQQDLFSVDPQFPGAHLYDATLYRRRLPHLRLDGATYFVTWRTFPDKTDLSPPERDIVKKAFHHFDQQRYNFFAFVIMNDHVHVLFEPIPQELESADRVAPLRLAASIAVKRWWLKK